VAARESTPAQKFKLYTVAELLELPEPDWLIKNLFNVGSLIGLYGPSGHGKSFLALDWALSIAEGLEWFGHSVRQGPVVYVAAEGGRSIGQRVRAWTQHRGIKDIHEAFFVLEGVQVRDRDDLDLLSAQIAELKPKLIVLDTLARCFIGGDENSAQEMGEFVEGLAWLQRETEAAVMVLHHTGKQDKDLERGSSAFRAAADVMIRVSMDAKGLILIRNNKQKDAEEFEDIKLRLDQMPGNEVGGEAISCVLVSSRGAAGSPEVDLPSHLRKALMTLEAASEGMTTKQWQAASGLKNRTLHSHRKKLVGLRCVEPLHGATRGLYRITQMGLTALGGATATKVHVA
jgi:hypothetical protein